MKCKKWLFIVAAAVLVVLLVVWLVWENTALEGNTYVIQGQIPPGVEGFVIAQVSDLHNTQNSKLLPILRKAEPDMIAITGDMIDSRRTDLDVAIAFAHEAVQIAPCYYVPGNHESRIEEYAQFREAMIAAGVIVLENAKTRIQYNNEEVTLAGIQDPDFTDVVDEADWISEQLSEILEPEDGFVILLSHRPEYLQTYAESEVDLVLSGHAHGGQIRLPFVGGVIAPNQGLFPDYDGGVYVQENTQMVVSRGVGNSVFPLRVNNRPEVVLIELRK